MYLAIYHRMYQSIFQYFDMIKEDIKRHDSYLMMWALGTQHSIIMNYFHTYSNRGKYLSLFSMILTYFSIYLRINNSHNNSDQLVLVFPFFADKYYINGMFPMLSMIINWTNVYIIFFT